VWVIFDKQADGISFLLTTELKGYWVFLSEKLFLYKCDYGL